MAIENTYLLGKNITLGCGFDLQAKAPLDSRQTVPAFEGLRALIIGDAAYEGMIVYDEGTKKTYQAQKCDSYTVEVDGKTKTYDIAFREFGINESELKALIASETTAAMEFKGAATTLPENPAKGDMWKVTASFEVAGETAKIGDSIVYNGEEWFRIPSGDDIEDTWRPVTDVNNDATLTFAAGEKLAVAVTANGTITYAHEEIAAPKPLAENEQTRTYITAVETDGYGHITGYKTATENVEDTNTTYEFEGLPVSEGQGVPSSVYFQVKSSEEEAAEVVYLDTYNKQEADAKFAKTGDLGTAAYESKDSFVATTGEQTIAGIKIFKDEIVLNRNEGATVKIATKADADYSATPSYTVYDDHSIDVSYADGADLHYNFHDIYSSGGDRKYADENGNVTIATREFVEAQFVSSEGYVAYSQDEKDKLAGIEAGAQVNDIEEIEIVDYQGAKVTATIGTDKKATIDISGLGVIAANNAASAGHAQTAAIAYQLDQDAANDILDNALDQAKTTIQGETTNTVKDCVDAINTMNNKTGAVIGTVENIVSQLTWGSF